MSHERTTGTALSRTRRARCDGVRETDWLSEAIRACRHITCQSDGVLVDRGGLRRRRQWLRMVVAGHRHIGVQREIVHTTGSKSANNRHGPGDKSAAMIRNFTPTFLPDGTDVASGRKI